MSLDAGALIVQAIGGANATKAVHLNESPEPGGKVMMYGIIVQMVGITIYVLCQSEFLLRYHFDKPVRGLPFVRKKQNVQGAVESGSEMQGRGTMDRGTSQVLVAMCFMTIWIYIRYVEMFLLRGVKIRLNLCLLCSQIHISNYRTC